MSLREFEREQERGRKFKVQSFIGGELEELDPDPVQDPELASSHCDVPHLRLTSSWCSLGPAP